MLSQISFTFDDVIIPREDKFLESDIRIDRGSRYGYCFTKVIGKEDILKFLELVHATDPFITADHCSYAFRVRSPEGLLVEGKSDDGETGAGQCILRELKRKNVEHVILVISRHFGGVYLELDRYKNVVEVSRLAIDKM